MFGENVMAKDTLIFDNRVELLEYLSETSKDILDIVIATTSIDSSFSVYFVNTNNTTIESIYRHSSRSITSRKGCRYNAYQEQEYENFAEDIRAACLK